MRRVAVRVLASTLAVAGLLHASRGGLCALTFGLTLLVLAHGLARGRRLAQVVTVTGLVVACLAPVALMLRLVLGVAAIALFSLRAEFPTAPDPRRLRLAGQFSVGVLILLVLDSGVGLVRYRDEPRQIGADLLAGVNLTDPPPGGHDGLLALFVAVGVLGLLALAFASAPPPPPGNAVERARVAALVAEDGPDSLAPFATRRDKSYVFSPDGRAAVAYRVLFGTALAGGDPVGDPASADAAIAAFLRLCDRTGWRAGVIGASAGRWRPPSGSAAGAGLGRRRAPAPGYRLRGLRIGDEAVLQTSTFTVYGRSMRNVRQSVQRADNAGVQVSVGPLSPALAVELRPVLAEWLHGRAERGFAMNLDALLVPRADCLVVVARDGTGRAVAFARFAIAAGGRLLTLDVAPRRPDAPNGTIERLVVEAVRYGRAHGAAEVSLNFAGLRRVFESRGPLGRIATLALRLFDPWIELWPLYRFCAKFRPTWRPRSLLALSWAAFLPVAVAALTAEFGANREPEGEAILATS